MAGFVGIRIFPEPDTILANRFPAWRTETADAADEERRLNPPAYGDMEPAREGLKAAQAKSIKAKAAKAKPAKAGKPTRKATRRGA